MPDLFNVHKNHTKLDGQESKKQFAVSDSATRATLKQDEGHQTWYEFVNPKQCYSDAKFEKPCLNGACKRVNDKVFVKPGSISVISPEYLQKSKIVVY